MMLARGNLGGQTGMFLKNSQRYPQVAKNRSFLSMEIWSVPFSGNLR